MPYEVHNFQSGDVLLASQLNEMDEQIALNEQNVSDVVSTNNIADDYNSTKTYAVGDYCFHDGTLYKCTTEITTAEAWTLAHWQTAILGNDTSDLKNAIDYTSNAVFDPVTVTLISGGFINLGGGVGSTISFTPSSNAGYAYRIINCKAGDQFVVTAKGGNNSRAWGLLDINKKLLSVAGAGSYEQNVSLTASVNGYLVVNAYIYEPTTYSTSVVQYVSKFDKKYPVEETAWNVDYYIVDGSTSIGSVVDITPSAFSSYSCMVLNCSFGDTFRITGRGGQGARLWAFVDGDNKLLQISDGGITVSNLELTAPADGKLIINSYNLIDHSVYSFETQTEAIDRVIEVVDEEPWNDHIWTFVMPKTVRVCGGIEMNFYHNNIARYVDTRKMQTVNMSNAKISNYDWFSRYTGVDNTSDFTTQMQIYSDNTRDVTVKSDSMTVHTVPSDAGSGANKKVMLIGDSMTDADATSGELVTMFGNDVMDMTLVGTLGTAPNLNEGRAGWRAYTYAYCATGADDRAGLSYTNPFYNPSTQQFDFEYYMTQNGFSGVDYVFICLGSNDIGPADHSTDENIISYYNLMINSIKDYDSDIIIGLWLPPTRALYVNTVKKPIDSALRANKLLIDTYSNSESSGIYLVPVYMNVDPEHDYVGETVPISSRNTSYTMTIATDVVHPAVVGYKKIADVIFSYIKHFATIGS